MQGRTFSFTLLTINILSATSLWAGSFMVSAEPINTVIGQAVANNPNVKEAIARYEQRNADIDVARADYLPQLNVRGTVGKQKITYDSANRQNGTENSQQIGVVLSQLLFDGFNTWNNIDRVKAETLAERYNTLSVAENTALEAASAYLSVLQRQEELTLAQRNIQVHEKIVQDITRKASSGVGSSADVSQANARLASARVSVISAQSNLHEATSQYLRVVGITPEQLQWPADSYPAMPADLATAFKTAQSRHSVLKMANADIQAAEYQYQQAASGYYPRLSLEASQNWNDNQEEQYGRYDEQLVALRVDMNLFAGGRDMAKRESAGKAINQATAIRDRSYLQLQDAVTQAWTAWQTSQSQRAELETAAKASEETVLAYRKQFAIGMRTLIDVLNAEQELFSARRSLIENRKALHEAYYRLQNTL
ncbi:MAG: TolC family outer membrane protein, partial [Plesiomonas sp.]